MAYQDCHLVCKYAIVGHHKIKVDQMSWKSSQGLGSDCALQVELCGTSVVVVIDAPGRANALNGEDLKAFRAVIEEVERDDFVRALVITGSGTKVFCSGYDLRELASGAPTTILNNLFPEVAGRLAALRKPVIAAINGAVVGAAVHLVLACDVRIARAGATLALPAARLGVVYDPESVVRIASELGLGFTRRLLLTAATLTAEELHIAGVIEDIVSAESLREAALARSASVAALAPTAIAGMKEILNAVSSRDGFNAQFRHYQERAARSDHLANVLRSISERVRDSHASSETSGSSLDCENGPGKRSEQSDGDKQSTADQE